MRKPVKISFLAISFLLELYTLLKQFKSRNLLQTLKGLSLLSVQDLKDKVASGICKAGDLVLCHGGITSSEPMSCILGPSTPVAYTELLMERTMDLGTRKSIIKNSIKKNHPSYLILSSFGSSINIYETLRAKLFPLMIRKKINVVREKILDFGWPLSYLISPTRTIQSLYTERYIPNQYYSVVFGAVDKSQGGEVFINKPLAIAPNKEVLVRSYTNEVNFQWLQTWFLVALTVSTFISLCVTVFRSKRVQEILREPRLGALQRIKKILVSSKSCSQCQKEMSSLIRMPCAHLSICHNCEMPDKGQQCEQCHRNYQETVQIYPC